jgi:hypothetical protein
MKIVLRSAGSNVVKTTIDSAIPLPKRNGGILVSWTWAVKILMKTVRGFVGSGAVREKRTLFVIEFQRNCVGPTASLSQSAKRMTSTASRCVDSNAARMKTTVCATL